MFFSTTPPAPGSPLSKATVHLRDARKALERCDTATSETQVQDAINSAEFFLRLAETSINYRRSIPPGEPKLQPPPRHP